MEREKLYLQSVIVKKPIELEEARGMAQKIIKNSNKKQYVETETAYHFRNIPKTQFIPGSFRTKVMNDQLTLLFGKLYEE